MTSSTSLPPHLERFVRELVATGHYRSEGEVIRAALQLLEASSITGPPPDPQPEDATRSRHRRSADPALTERWESPADWLAGASGKDVPSAPARRSPRGFLADLRSGLSYDAIKQARSEMWASLSGGKA